MNAYESVVIARMSRIGTGATHERDIPFERLSPRLQAELLAGAKRIHGHLRIHGVEDDQPRSHGRGVAGLKRRA